MWYVLCVKEHIFGPTQMTWNQKKILDIDEMKPDRYLFQE